MQCPSLLQILGRIFKNTGEGGRVIEIDRGQKLFGDKNGLKKAKKLQVGQV